MYKNSLLITLLILFLSCATREIKSEIEEKETPPKAKGIIATREEPIETVEVVPKTPKVVKLIPTEVETFTVIGVETSEITPEDSGIKIETEVGTGLLPILKKGFQIQVGAFKVKKSAIRLYQELKSEFEGRVYIEYIYPYWKIRIGGCSSDWETTAILKKLQKRGFKAFKIPPSPKMEIPVKGTTPEEIFRVQVGIFKIKENAIKLQKELKNEFREKVCIIHIHPYWKVEIGKYTSLKEASTLTKKLREKGIDAFIVW